jgi:hypothetical protein
VIQKKNIKAAASAILREKHLSFRGNHFQSSPFTLVRDGPRQAPILILAQT